MFVISRLSPTNDQSKSQFFQEGHVGDPQDCRFLSQPCSHRSGLSADAVPAVAGHEPELRMAALGRLMSPVAFENKEALGLPTPPRARTVCKAPDDPHHGFIGTSELVCQGAAIERNRLQVLGSNHPGKEASQSRGEPASPFPGAMLSLDRGGDLGKATQRNIPSWRLEIESPNPLASRELGGSFFVEIPLNVISPFFPRRRKL